MKLVLQHLHWFGVLSGARAKKKMAFGRAEQWGDVLKAHVEEYKVKSEGRLDVSVEGKKKFVERLKGHPVVEGFIVQPRKLQEDPTELFVRLKIDLKNYKKNRDESLQASELVCRLCEHKIPLCKFLVRVAAPPLDSHGAVHQAHRVQGQVSKTR